jgi:hypothetical protein
MGSIDWVAIGLLIAVGIAWWVFWKPATKPTQPVASAPARAHVPVHSELGRAIAARDHDAVKRLLDDDADPNEAARDDLPALFAAVAAFEGDDRTVRLLIARGANVEHVSKELGSALSLALTRNAHDLAHLLIDQGVPLDAVNEGGATALHMAAFRGDVGMVSLLVDRGIPVDVRSFLHGTPLRAASEAGHLEVVELLLSRGADPEPVDVLDALPSDYALRNGHHDIVHTLDRASKRGNASATPRVRPRKSGPASSRAIVWGRGDASITVVSDSVRRGIQMMDVACSSIEAPSATLAIQRAVSGLAVSALAGDAHDPREPIGEVSFRLWTYEGIEPKATITPKPETRALVGAFAKRPYSLAGWSDVAKELAEDLDEDAIDDVLAVMTDPPEGPSYLTAWDFWFRAQIAAALLVSHIGKTPWPESKRRARLFDLTRGPCDWANGAAMIALLDVATREPRTKPEIREALLALTKIEMTPPRYQHVMQPAALILRELGDLDAATTADLDELIHPPDGEAP